MLRSLFSGVAGLKTHQTKMDVIGNNIANVNTYGFKSSRVTFKDVFYQTISGSSDATAESGGGNPTQIGYGSMVGSIDVLHTRSGQTPTGRSMDVFIEGEGYLIARDGSGNEMYTRVGILGFDGDGNLVDGNKNFICGYPIARNADGTIRYKSVTAVGASGVAGNSTFNFGAANGDKMNDWNVVIKQGTGISAPPAVATDPVATVSGKNITITLPAQADGTAVPCTFAQIQAALTGMDAAESAKLPNGVDPAQFTVAAAVAGATDVTVGTGTAKGGVTAQTGIPELDKANGPQKIKKPGTMTDLDGDGVPDTEGNDVCELNGISIGPDGVITGTVGGKIIPIGQICLANVPNPEAMVLEGSSYFRAENNTGDITYAAAGSSKAVGSLVSGALEMSNVDLSTEFADMITTQRGFQANSRIITVGDEMLQELVSMKR